MEYKIFLTKTGALTLGDFGEIKRLATKKEFIIANHNETNIFESLIAGDYIELFDGIYKLIEDLEPIYYENKNNPNNVM